MSKQTPVPLEFEGEQLEGVFVGRRDGQARPTVILIPTVMGVSDLELGFGNQLVELGYNAFVADLFGKNFRGSPRDVMFGEMTRLGNDRVALRRRLLAIVDKVRALPGVSGGQLAVAGFCFGGKCALDVARTGADIAAAVAFHGWDDPMAPPEHVVALAKELTEAGADWQIHAFGHVAHGFTNPKASEIGIEGVRYNALAAERSWTSFINLLEELFAGHG